MNKLEGKYDERVIQRGKNYLHHVKSCVILNQVLYSQVQGTSLYTTKFNLKTFEGECSCPYEHNCKHAVATYLYYKKIDIVDVNKYVEGLKKLGKEELIKIIIKLLPQNPKLIFNDEFKRKVDFNDWIDDFIDNPSRTEIETINDNLESLKFGQLITLLDYIFENQEKIFNSIMDSDNYGGWHNEDDVLGDFEYELRQELVNRIDNEKKLKIVLEKRHINEEIIDNSESFFKYKKIIKEFFDEKEYFIFLLKCKIPDLQEIKMYVSEENKYELYSVSHYNLILASKLAEFLDDDLLRFIVAYEKDDAKNVINYFNSFEKLDMTYFINPEKLVSILIKSNLDVPKKFFKSVFIKENIKHYFLESQIKYLIEQINDIEFILKNISSDLDFEKLKVIFSYLDHEKYDVKKIFLKNDLLSKKHWTKVVDILKYVKAKFGNNFLLKYIELNEDVFRTSSTLKSNLREFGILIRVRKGNFEVEVK